MFAQRTVRSAGIRASHVRPPQGAIKRACRGELAASPRAILRRDLAVDRARTCGMQVGVAHLGGATRGGLVRKAVSIVTRSIFYSIPFVPGN